MTAAESTGKTYGASQTIYLGLGGTGKGGGRRGEARRGDGRKGMCFGLKSPKLHIMVASPDLVLMVSYSTCDCVVK